MISFTCDYNEGAHPFILQRLVETNMQQEDGYGEDSFTALARQRIRQACECPDADVFFLVGGTQTNATVIDAILPRYAAVVGVESGHIAVHEAGAVEHSGHKVITLPAESGKMNPDTLRDYFVQFYHDPTWQHMAQPRAVYISFPTEYGTIYSHGELQALYDICKQFEVPLFIDGARLGYGLASKEADITLSQLAQCCNVFYIGGTKIGALCGEAVVFPKGDAPKDFFSIVKQHGALLAKGRVLGLQFDTLFTDELYHHLSRHAIDMAMQLKQLFAEKGIPLYMDSPTNQQFPILTPDIMQRLYDNVLYEVWEELPDGRAVTRFATSWATPQEHVDALREFLK